MKNSSQFLVLAVLMAALSACADPTPLPDNTIRVGPSPDGKGMVATQPNCVSWADNPAIRLDNAPLPQFGCATARNLAVMVDQPSDLLQGRPLDPARGIVTSGSILRYDQNQTRGLIYPSQSGDTSVDTTTNSTASSGLNGDTASSAGK